MAELARKHYGPQLRGPCVNGGLNDVSSAWSCRTLDSPVAELQQVWNADAAPRLYRAMPFRQLPLGTVTTLAPLSAVSDTERPS
ncbi:hypothetical protein J2126_004883 [Xanthobacter flavus]|nr:hypothetical protein [Xanthobacter flavus]